MCASKDRNDRVATASHDVGDAAGVAGGSEKRGVNAEKGTQRRWYVAVVTHNSEKRVAERLATLGYESFVASQQVRRVWKNGRKSTIDKVVIPSKVFVRCTEAERREIVRFPFINRFLTDRALSGDTSTSRLAIIPPVQIDRLRFMLGQSDVPVEITAIPYRLGDRVTVVRGSLKGLEGEIIRINDGHTELAVRVDVLGCARITIDSADVTPIN
ncbi:MAG: UpxY family transcription antiterminator [Muribaculaceae bacterium]|nr:UpxY family transcription antiterminator [Muribaculaceae bacterium]